MKILILWFCLAGAVAGQSVGLSVNGETAAQIETGMPLIVSATVVGDAGIPSLSVLGPDGSAAAIPLVSRGVSVWTVAPEALRQLAAGRYVIKADRAREVTFTVVSSSTAETAESRAARLLLLSSWAELEGDSEKALGYVEELLGAQPESIAARLRMADLLEARGRLAEALARLDEAETILRRAGRLAQPPVTIRVRQRRILDAME